MIVTRWQGQVIPTKEQLKMILSMEGLEPVEETYPGRSKVEEHRHPFDEIRVVVAGQVIFNINGNKLLLRAGDRLVIPSNTKHESSVDHDDPCVSFYANRTF